MEILENAGQAGNKIMGSLKSIISDAEKVLENSTQHGSESYQNAKRKLESTITDAKFVSRHSIERMKGSKTLIVNALRKEPHLSHFCLQEALALVEEIGPERAFLTHIGHTLDYAGTSRLLPPNVQLAYDGLCIDF